MAATIVACHTSSSHPTEAGVTADASVAGLCSRRFSVTARISGSWIGDPTSDFSPPALVVGVDDASSGSLEAREIARLALPEPFFAAEVGLSDLCSDEGSTLDRISVRCVTKRGDLSQIVIVRQDGRLSVVVDGGPPRNWKMEHFEDACFDLHGFETHRDLEPTRAAWGRDAPSDRCVNAKAQSPVRVQIDFLRPPKTTDEPQRDCMGAINGPAGSNSSLLRMIIPAMSTHADVGILSNQCAGIHATRYADVDAISIETSDMGYENRIFYRLGDRIYFLSADGRLASEPFPCAAHATFSLSKHDVTIDDAHALMLSDAHH